MKKFFTLFALMFFAIPCSFSQIAIKGHAYGWDAKPMPKANMTLYSLPKQSTPIPIGEDGSFAFSVPKPEGYQLYVTGVNHEDMSMPLIITATTPVELNLQLAATTPNKPHQDSVWVVQNAIGKPKRTLMTKQADGTYKAQIETSAKVYAYQIEGFVERLLGMNETETFPLLVTGTQYDKLGYLSIPRNAIIGSRYISQIEVTQSPFDLVFDPQKVFKEGTKAIVTSTPAQVASFGSISTQVDELSNEVGAMSKANFEQTSKLKMPQDSTLFMTISKPFGDKIDTIREIYEAKIHSETNPMLKEWMLLELFSKIGSYSRDSTLVPQFIEGLSSNSPLLSAYFLLNRRSEEYQFGFFPDMFYRNEEGFQQFIDRILAGNEYPLIKTSLVYGISSDAFWRLENGVKDESIEEVKVHRDKLRARFQKYYNILQSQYGDTELAKRAKLQWDNNRNIQIGKPLPAFSLEDIEHENTFFTDEQFRGKVLLVQFWGTWCGPCVEEIPHIQSIYEKYHDQGLEILSIAAQETKENIAKFRSTKFSMPWHHSLLKNSTIDKAVSSLFEITGYPTLILIDRDGRIISRQGSIEGQDFEDKISEACTNK
jgi:thiol-disulfide isomerase/thioredoxin